MQLVARAAVELEVSCARDDIRACLLHRFAAVARLDERELVGRVENGARELRKKPALLDRRKPTPGAVARALRRADSPIDVRRRSRSDRCERKPIGRIDHRQRIAALGFNPGVVDEMLRSWVRGGRNRERARRSLAPAFPQDVFLFRAHGCLAGANFQASVFSSVRGT
jgi:hypothetical protein